MNRFHSAREAKEFLASEIAEEARREDVAFSEVERKMLYFSETAWTLPDMSAVNEEFDRSCDQDEYEQKVARLIKRAYRRALRASEEEYEDWWSAIRLLSRQDHYLLVMIRLAGLRPRGDELKLLSTAVGIVALIVGGEFLSLFVGKKYRIDFGNYWPSKEKVGFVAWAGAMALAVIATFFYYASRTQLLGGLLGQFVKRAARRINGGS